MSLGMNAVDVAPRGFVVSSADRPMARAWDGVLNRLQEHVWTLPSDHLPIAAQIGEIRLGSWNVLNTAYVRNLQAHNRGLEGATLFEENHPYEHYEAITLREHRVISSVLTALPHLDAIFLQECSPRFLDALRLRCPSEWEIILGRSAGAMNNICALVNTKQLTIDRVRSEIIETAYPLCREIDHTLQRPIMNLVLCSAAGEELRVIHTHVPGDPKWPGLADLSQYCKPFLLSETEPIAIVGDLNFCRDALQRSFDEHGLPLWWQSLEGKTIFANNGEPKQIDHILYFGEDRPYMAMPSDIFGRDAAEAWALLNSENQRSESDQV